MGKYDYKDPGLDHGYCDPLAADPDDSWDDLKTWEPPDREPWDIYSEDRVCSYCGQRMPYTWSEDYCSMFCAIDAQREENGE